MCCGCGPPTVAVEAGILLGPGIVCTVDEGMMGMTARGLIKMWEEMKTRFINGLVWDYGCWRMDIVGLGGGRMKHDDRCFVLRW